MNFYDFMMFNYLDTDTAEGDLAADMKHESGTFPRCGEEGYETIYRYLLRHHACFACLRVFEKCWKEYTGNAGEFD